MGKQGGRRRKPVRHLPKVQGNPGSLWSDQLSPWSVGAESAQRWVGRAGPEAQAAYARGHRRARPRLPVGRVLAGTCFVVMSLAAVLLLIR